ncbi:MAG: 3'(2'),5'-bisphosphate nucleotidase CysQ, partial [Sphingobacteriales bacterium]
MDWSSELLIALKAALNAGRAIRKVYNQDFDIVYKEDQSPLTLADQQAHEEIKAALGNKYPLLSEEGRQIPFHERKDWHTFWLVDPLDGTKEFIKRNGEFTVNIALVQDGAPVLGVVYLPVTGKLYWGLEGKGSFSTTVPGSISADELPRLISKATSLPSQNLPSTYTVVASRSHLSAETETFIDRHREQHGQVDAAGAYQTLLQRRQQLFQESHHAA